MQPLNNVIDITMTYIYNEIILMWEGRIMAGKKLIIFVVVIALIVLAIVGIVNGVKTSREAMNNRIIGMASQINDYNTTH